MHGYSDDFHGAALGVPEEAGAHPPQADGSMPDRASQDVLGESTPRNPAPRTEASTCNQVQHHGNIHVLMIVARSGCGINLWDSVTMTPSAMMSAGAWSNNAGDMPGRTRVTCRL